MKNLDDLTIVILTFQTPDEIIFNCLRSIDKNVKIIIVENSKNFLHEKKISLEFPNVKIICTGKNLGYGGGNNVGLKLVKTNYALVLNPDTKIKVNTINNFFNFSKIKKDFWLVGPSNNQSQKTIGDENNIYELIIRLTNCLIIMKIKILLSNSIIKEKMLKKVLEIEE